MTKLSHQRKLRHQMRVGKLISLLNRYNNRRRIKAGRLRHRRVHPSLRLVRSPQIPPKPEHLLKKTPQQGPQKEPLNQSSKAPEKPAGKKQMILSDDEEEFIEYKFTPRQVFLATICQVCKIALQSPNPCLSCLMVSYCSEAHAKEDAVIHQPLCRALQEIARKRGGHVYNNAKILSSDDFRNLRVHTLNLCESLTQRPLQPFEKEILIFPRICCTPTCREWRPPLLTECQKCGQVSYCREQPAHLSEDHQRWCPFFLLYQKLIIRQKTIGRIEPTLPSRIFLQRYELPATMEDVFKELYKNNPAIKDDCSYATLTQLATAPLTAYSAMQKVKLSVAETLTIHLVGAELQFEGDTLDKWEAFFLHLIPQVLELRVVFIGPELNAENLPLDILSRIRMCRTCRQSCRGVKATGFSGLDTWPETIKVTTSLNCPIVVTSYTELEARRTSHSFIVPHHAP
uniref:MYND-type domain-containing protein n=1 Tax=Lutzomyia longipalpis TaxID=7200 RepID=A0A1B0CJD5_LUTLO